MNRTARRRATHHVATPPDPDPVDVRTSAAAIARVALPLLAGAPDALTAERLVSDLAAGWSTRDVERVVLAIEAEEPDSPANAALHAIAWTLSSPLAADLVNLRADEQQLSPPWAADLGRATPVSATGTAAAGESVTFVTFDGPQPHVLAAGTFARRRTRLGLVLPGTTLPGSEALTLAAAADRLATAVAPGRKAAADGAMDLRHLARRRLDALREAT